MKMFSKKIKKMRYAQYLYSIAAMTSLIAPSAHFVWTSPAIPQLMSDDSPIGVKLTSIESSLVAALNYLGVAIGSLFAIYPVEHWGRKATLLLSQIPAIVGAILLYFAQSAEMIYGGRIIAGISGGMMLSVAPIYNAEIAESEIRGQVSNFMTILGITGNLFVFCIGPFVSYHTLALCMIALPIVCIFIIFSIPESPYFLIKKGKNDAMLAVIKKLSSNYATDEFIEKRVEEIKASVEKDMKNKTYFWEILKPQYRKRLIITICLRVLMYSSGLYCIFSYLQTIMKLSGSSFSPAYASILFGVVNIIAGIISGPIIDKAGRKPVYTFCIFMAAVSLYAEGIYFYLLENKYDISSLFWLPITALVVYEIFIIPGVLGLPFILIGEIFPINVKSIAMSINTFLGAPLGLTALLTFQPMMNNWGKHVPFFIYAVFCTIGFFFGIFVMPETKGKSLEEIQKSLG